MGIPGLLTYLLSTPDPPSMGAFLLPLLGCLVSAYLGLAEADEIDEGWGWVVIEG